MEIIETPHEETQQLRVRDLAPGVFFRTTLSDDPRLSPWMRTEWGAVRMDGGIAPLPEMEGHKCWAAFFENAPLQVTHPVLELGLAHTREQPHYTFRWVESPPALVMVQDDLEKHALYQLSPGGPLWLNLGTVSVSLTRGHQRLLVAGSRKKSLNLPLQMPGGGPWIWQTRSTRSRVFALYPEAKLRLEWEVVR